MTKAGRSDDSLVDLHFPLGGVNVAVPYERPRAVQLPTGEYSKHCNSGNNVRGFEAHAQRMRGGSRAGLARYINRAVVAGWIVQDLNLVVGTGYAPPGGSVQLSQSGRVVTLVAVSQGQVYVAQAGDTAWTPAINATGANPPLNYTGVIFSSANNQKLYFADSVNYCYYDPRTNTVYRWAATVGTLPRDTAGNAPRLICTWRGRTVLSGLLLDPQNWFMSAVSNPDDWDYAPLAITPTQAVAGNNSPLGLVGDVITSLVPYSDDVLLVGGDHTIWQMQGDPMAGGQIDLVSDAIGMAWGMPWCKAPDGTLYFLSNRTGIYALKPGEPLQRISQQIEQLLLAINTGDNSFRLLWSDRFQGLHVFVSPLSAPAATTHFFWEQRAGAWWTDTFANHDHDPVACCTFDGNRPEDRAVLVGSWDGYVRTFSADATTDDGTAVASSVLIGPLLTKDMDDLLLYELQGILGADSGSVSYAVYVGATAEIALAQTAIATGTFAAGRNLSQLIRRSGHAIWVQLTSSVPWAMEAIRCRISTTGKVRRRGH